MPPSRAAAATASSPERSRLSIRMRAPPKAKGRGMIARGQRRCPSPRMPRELPKTGEHDSRSPETVRAERSARVAGAKSKHAPWDAWRPSTSPALSVGATSWPRSRRTQGGTESFRCFRIATGRLVLDLDLDLDLLEVEV